MAAFPRRHAVFRYYAELNDFLPPARRFVPFAHNFELPASVKDMIESMGVTPSPDPSGKHRIPAVPLNKGPASMETTDGGAAPTTAGTYGCGTCCPPQSPRSTTQTITQCWSQTPLH
jgi:Mut7-C ubiquitin